MGSEPTGEPRTTRRSPAQRRGSVWFWFMLISRDGTGRLETSFLDVRSSRWTASPPRSFLVVRDRLGLGILVAVRENWKRKLRRTLLSLAQRASYSGAAAARSAGKPRKRIAKSVCTIMAFFSDLERGIRPVAPLFACFRTRQRSKNRRSHTTWKTPLPGYDCKLQISNCKSKRGPRLSSICNLQFEIRNPLVFLLLILDCIFCSCGSAS